MPPIVRERPHLARPAAVFDRLGPRRADKDVGAVDLVNRAVAWAVMRDLLLSAADAHGEGLSCHPRHRAYARHLEKIGDVLGVVDLVEERSLSASTSMFTTNRYLELIGMRTCLAYLALTSPRHGDRAIVGDVLLRRHRLEGPRRVDRLNIRRNVDPLLSPRPPGLARSAQGADPRARSAHRRSPPPSMGPARLALSAR